MAMFYVARYIRLPGTLRTVSLQERFQGVLVATPLELANIKLPGSAAKFAGHGRRSLGSFPRGRRVGSRNGGKNMTGKSPVPRCSMVLAYLPTLALKIIQM